MIISHKHKFIFIKTRKTAGTSIETSLSRYCGPDDVVTPISPEDEAERTAVGTGAQNYLSSWPDGKSLLKGRIQKGKRFWAHMRACDVKRRLPAEIWQSYFKFCFERNPWDKVVSFYYYQMKAREQPRHRQGSNVGEFVRYRRHKLANDVDKYLIDGRVAVDRIGRYENLADDLTEILSQVGIEFDGWLPRAKGGFRCQRQPYQSHFDADGRDWVARKFAKEIELLGYEFEPNAVPGSVPQI